jgi:hypothetical protein
VKTVIAANITAAAEAFGMPKRKKSKTVSLSMTLIKDIVMNERVKREL